MKMNGHDSSKNRRTLRPIFIFRLSAIGDVMIAARTVQYLVKNNYEPCFVSSINLKDILLKIKDLKHFICLNDEYKPAYFLDHTEVDKAVFRNYFCSIKEHEYKNKNIEYDRNELRKPAVFCDLQKTSRSRRAIRVVKSDIFKKEKIIVNKVKKNFLHRIFMILETYFRNTQEQRRSPLEHIERIHELQLDIINKIFENDKKPTQNLTQNVYLSASSNTSPKKYICIFPGASGELKIWPQQHFRTLIGLILERTAYDVYICGREKDFNEFAEEITPIDRVHNVIGKHSLAESLNLVANASYLFCNDSFATHVADAYQIPATVIFGGTTPRFGFAPVSSRIKIQYLNLMCSPCSRHGKGTCRFGNLKCLSQIDPNEIFKDFLFRMH